MREILFRGKCVKTGKWLVGSLIVDEKNNYYMGEVIVPIPSKAFRAVPARRNGKTLNRFVGIGFSMIIPETVGQYTGLTDNNGNKIFEGDIVEGADFTVEDGGYAVVSFDDGAFEVGGNNIIGTFHENYWGKEFEVIGNIHDNPELLEEVSNG